MSTEESSVKISITVCWFLAKINEFVERFLQNSGSFHFIIKMVSIKTKISKINMEIKHFRITKYLKTTTILKSEKRGAAFDNCMVIVSDNCVVTA